MTRVLQDLLYGYRHMITNVLLLTVAIMLFTSTIAMVSDARSRREPDPEKQTLSQKVDTGAAGADELITKGGEGPAAASEPGSVIMAEVERKNFKLDSNSGVSSAHKRMIRHRVQKFVQRPTCRLLAEMCDDTDMVCCNGLHCMQKGRLCTIM